MQQKGFIYMDENITQGAANTDESLTIKQADYDAAIAKAVQSAEDKIRGDYSKKVKALEAKIVELTPIQKTEAEIALEKRLADIEAKQTEVAAKEAKLNLQTALSAKGLDASLVDYIRDDADPEAVATALKGIVDVMIKSNGFVPSGHKANQGMTQDEFNKLTYAEMADIYAKSPDLIKKFL